MKIVCIGDSLTYGYGVRKSLCWVERLRASLGIEIINEGVNGDTTSGILSRSYDDVIEQKPSHTIYMAGVNDLLLGRSLERLIDNVEVFLKEVMFHDIIPIIGIPIPICSEMAKVVWSPAVDYDRVNDVLAQYREWITANCKQYQLLYIDFYKLFEALSSKAESRKYYLDGLHPTAEGHELMLKEAEALLRCHL